MVWCSARCYLRCRVQQAGRNRQFHDWVPGEYGRGDRPAPVIEGLRDFGYIEGKNITIEWRAAAGNLDRLSTFVQELVPAES